MYFENGPRMGYGHRGNFFKSRRLQIPYDDTGLSFRSLPTSTPPGCHRLTHAPIVARPLCLVIRETPPK